MRRSSIKNRLILTTKRFGLGVMALLVLISCTLGYPTRSYAAATGSGTIHLVDGTNGGAEVATDADLASANEVPALQAGWGWSSAAGTVGGMAPTNACAVDAVTLDPGSLSKWFYTAGTTTTTTPAKQSLTFSGASSVSSGTGTTTFTNMTINLTGGSHLDCSSGGSLVFKNCTITIDGTSYITSAGSLSLDGCSVTGSKGSATDIQLTGGTCALTGTDAFTGCSIDTAKAASITTSGTTTLTDCALTGTTDRTTPLFSVTGGTTEVAGTTTITGITNTNGGSKPGGVFNVSAGTLKLTGGTISGCNITAPGSMSGGGAVAYASGGTISLTGTTVSTCGSGTAGQWTCGSFVLGGGSMSMSGGTITGCKGSHGGAISIVSGSSAFSMSGGTITGCTAAYDGGAVFGYNGPTITMSGGSITGCSAERTGSAISTRTGATVKITGGSITGNTTYTGGDANDNGKAAIAGYSSGNTGTYTISGNTTISGNKNASGAAADVMAYSATSLKIDNLGVSARVGVTSSTASLLTSGAQFAVASSGTASSTTNLGMLFNDSDATLVGTAGTESIVKWDAQAVCKIVDNDTTYTYSTLQAAIDAVGNGTIPTTATIQMLVENYPMTTTHIIDSTKDITITTAAEGATDGYPYRGTSGTKATLTRSSTGSLTGSLFAIGGSTAGALTLTGITVSGDSVAGVTALGGLANLSSGGILNCASGSTFRDSTVIGSGHTGAIYNYGGTVNLSDGSTISNCGAASPTGAGAILTAASGTLNMGGGTITDCGSSTSAAVMLMSLNGTPSTMTMSGGTITGTPANPYGAVYANTYRGTGTATLNLSGGTITGNGSAGVVLGTNGKLAMTGGSITTNTGVGVDIQSTSSATMSAGSVTGNKAGGVTIESGGTMAVSGAPQVTGNTVTSSGTTTNQNVYLAAAASGKQLTVTADLSGADLGISVQAADHADGTDFAFGSSHTVTANEASQFSDDTGTLAVSLDSTTNAVQFDASNTYVCKIVDTSGKATGYTTLQGAIDAVGTGGTATIQMLVESYDISAIHTIANSRNVTITTAKTVAEGCTDGFPYRGTAGTTATLRSTKANPMFSMNDSNSTLGFSDIMVDGNDIGRIVTVTAGTLDLGDGTTFTRGRATQGSAICASGASTSVTMSGNATITGCTSTDAGAIDLFGGSTFTMKDSSSIQNNTGSLHASAMFIRNSTLCNVYLQDDATIKGNTCTNASANCAAINTHPGSAAIHLSGNASITGNSTASSASSASAIWLRENCSLDITGNASITGNTATASATTGGVYASSSATISVQGNAVVDDNTNTSVERNLYTANNTAIKVTGNLGTDAKVGVYCTGKTAAGDQFGTATSSGTEVAASTYENIDHFVNDANPNLYGMTKDATSSAVVWGKGTCQIIRNGAYVDSYETLADACAAAQTGDTIQIYRSHELTTAATFTAGVTGVTITTAPTTQTVASAYAYVPAKGDDATTATVRRASSYTDGSLLTISTTGDSVDNVIFDSQGISSSASTIAVNEDATLTDVTVTNCVSTGTSAAVEVASGKSVGLAGKVSISKNVDENKLAANVRLDSENSPTSTGLIKVLGDLGTGSSVGVTVIDADHVSYVPWAQAYTNSTATETSITVAADSTKYFFDDLAPKLNIGANNTGSHTTLNTYLYFEPPMAFSFKKVSNNLEQDPIAGVQFHVYMWKGANSAYNKTDYTSRDTYLTDAALAGDTADWEPLTTANGNTKVFTSDASGVVDFGDPTDGGGLPDGIFRVVEVSTPDNHTNITSLGGWHFVADSTQADPYKVTLPGTYSNTTTTDTDPWANPLKASTATTGVLAASYDSAAGTWVVENQYADTVGQLKVFAHVTGGYADMSKAFSFTGKLTDSTSTTRTFTGTIRNASGVSTGTTITFTSGVEKTFTLSDGQYLQLDGLAASTTSFEMVEDAATNYTLSFPTTDGWNSFQDTTATLTTNAVTRTASGTIGTGETRVDFQNTSADVPVTGVRGLGNPLLLAGIVAGCVLGLVLVAWTRRRRAKRGW
ncbi:MAG: pilin N-terminal domain-containing protein [Atopobiaceae bacterium]|jgi:hypothetical protein|nr:pilin N-terminal domain-containing protein [Atopobiaceae bacterium]MDD4381005.1 pilin N-terminal domain-containing protein [Atopobiaceae bacterium]